MTRLNVSQARCEALFASGLQPSDAPTADAVADAISRTARQLGTHGCLSQMAQEFGDHPEAAAERMRWARQLVATLGYMGAAASSSSPANRLPTGTAGPPNPHPALAQPARPLSWLRQPRQKNVVMGPTTTNAVKGARPGRRI